MKNWFVNMGDVFMPGIDALGYLGGALLGVFIILLPIVCCCPPIPFVLGLSGYFWAKKNNKEFAADCCIIIMGLGVLEGLAGICLLIVKVSGILGTS